MAYEDQNVNSGAAETDNFSQAEVTEAAGEVAAEAYEVENYAKEAYEHKSTLDEEQIKKLSKKKISKGELKRQSVLLIIGAIFVLYGLLFYYLPLGGWIMAFQNYKIKTGLLHSKFVGFDKFKFMFEFDRFEYALETTGNVFSAFKTWINNVVFVRTIRNTIGMGALNLVTTFIMAIVFAILLNEVKNKFGKRLVQTISYLPHFLSWIIVCGIIHDSLSSTGIVNDVLRFFHIVDDSYNFFAHPLWFWPIVAFSNVWKETGWNAIIYLAAITAIDPSLYEAAEIDGAGRWAKIRYITLPSIASTIVILLVMNIGNLLNAGFEVQYLLGNGLVQDVSQTIDIYVLNWGVGQTDYSLGTAAGIFKSVVAIILIVVANTIVKKLGQESLF
ncbi:MAG: ABC transporter permease subunit [Lachnospiraceae bacterium]|nr:ABC transporter permease subunit [Lachnospiraceae bacterium]